eukprot:817798-Pelagomonas_calceolata.AAC.2
MRVLTAGAPHAAGCGGKMLLCALSSSLTASQQRGAMPLVVHASNTIMRASLMEERCKERIKDECQVGARDAGKMKCISCVTCSLPPRVAWGLYLHLWQEVSSAPY